MSFLEQRLGDMSEEELVRLIKRVIQQEVPPIPAGVAALDDADAPLVPPATPEAGQVLTYDDGTGQWDAADIPPVDTSVISSDGAAPGSSPTPTVRGNIGSLVVQWTPVSNNDLVIYEVHVSQTTGFTPGAGTLVGETPGALCFVRKDAAGDPLEYDTDYYVKIVAKDDDGSAAASLETGPTQLDPAGTDDILANAITAEKLETVLSLASSMVAGTPGTTRVEMGYGVNSSGDIDPGFIGIRSYDGTNKITFKLDAALGTALFRGKVYFGRFDADTVGSSKLTTDDMIQIAEQAGGSWQTPTLEQGASSSDDNVSSITATFDQATTAGNILLLVASNWDIAGAGGQTASDSSGLSWSSLKSNSFASNGRQQIWVATSTGASNSVTVTFDKTVDLATIQVYEFSGVQAVEDGASAADTGTSGPATTGTTGSLTQTSMVFGAITIEGNYSNIIPIITPSLDLSITNYTNIGDVTARPLSGLGRSGDELETAVWTRTTSSGTHSVSSDLTDVDNWRGQIVTLKAKAAAVTSAEANSVRLYAKDVSGKSYLHAVDESGSQSALVLGAQGQVWKMEILTGTLNLASLGAHTGTTQNITVTGVVSTDYVLFLDTTNVTHRGFIVRAKPTGNTADTVELRIFNTDSSALDPVSDTYHFLVIHRA